MTRIRVADVQAVVASHYGLTVAEMVSPARPRRISRPRAVACWLAERLTGQSLRQIGSRFRMSGQAAHYGVLQTDKARAKNRTLRSELTGLEAEILAAAERARLEWSA